MRHVPSPIRRIEAERLFSAESHAPQMASHDPSDYEGLNKLNEQLTAVNSESDDLEAEWLELSEQLE